MIEPIETERLLIRAFNQHDPIREWCSPSDRENWTFTYQPERWLEYYRGYATPGCGYRAIVLRKRGEVIGRIGLTPRHMFVPPEIELCYALAEASRGEGYIGEAAKSMLDHAQNELDLDRVLSRITPDNVASQRVAERAGLTYENEVLWRGQRYRLYWYRKHPARTEVLEL